MKLRGIDFGNILGGSGVQGFFGEGYWFHKLWRPFGLNFEGMTFVSKTATVIPREGNMPLNRDWTPKSIFPACIKVRPLEGVMLNSIGLSNPGLKALLDSRKWQKRKSPFLISITSIANNRDERMREFTVMAGMIETRRSSLVRENGFSAPIGLQINLSCPNSGENAKVLMDEWARILEAINELIPGAPLMPKFSIASAPIKAILELNSHPACDAICVSNSLPFGWEGIDWKKVWGTNTSPFAKLGGGGLSGKALRPLVCEWIARVRDAGFTKPINGGGGILSSKDVDRYRDAGASSVFIGSVAVLRPWRARAIIRQANRLRWE